MPKKATKVKTPKKPNQSLSVVDQIHAHLACIQKDEVKLPALYNKALAQLEKQLSQHLSKTEKAKIKAKANAQKLKAAKEKFKAKKTEANKSAVEKLAIQSSAIKADLAVLITELADVKKKHGELKLSHKKFLGQEKARTVFDKSWNKSLVTKLKKKKVAAKKKKAAAVSSTE
jgi:hypothetical protein